MGIFVSSFSSIMLLRCLIGVGLSVAISATILDDLVPGMDFLESKCNDDGECFRTKTVLVDDTAWIESVSQLKYHEPRLFYVDTLELNAQCAPDVDSKHLADALSSCEDKPLEDVCEFKKKGWLKANGEADSILLKAAFLSLTGGTGLVNTCLNLPDENEYDYTYEYDYYDYYNDNYDYRVRRDVSARRNRRQIGGKKKGTEANRSGLGKGKAPPKKVSERKKEGGRSGPAGTNVKAAPKGKAQPKNGLGGKGGDGVQGVNQGQGQGRGFVKKAGTGTGTKKKGGPKGNQGPKAPGAQNFTQILSNLGLSEIPEKTVMDTLICVKDEARNLIKKCGKDILSNAP